MVLSCSYTVWSWCVASLTVGVTLLSSLVEHLDPDTHMHMNWQAKIQSYSTHVHVHVFAALHDHMHARMHTATNRNSNTRSLLSSVPRKGLHASYHSNIASDSNSGIACLVVAVVSVIQEQLLRRPWTQTSFLPGACHWQTQAWRVSFLWARREGLSLRGTMAPAHATHQPQPKSLTWPQKPRSAVSSLNWQDKKTLIIQLQ